MRVKLFDTLPRSNYEIVEISLSEEKDLCIRGKQCRGEYVGYVGAPSEYFIFLKHKDETGGGFHTFYCGECLSYYIGWLRLEMIKVKLLRERQNGDSKT